MTTIDSHASRGGNSNTRPARRNRLATLAGIVAMAAVGITTACSAGVAPQDISGAASGVHQTRSVRAAQDNPNGCTPFGGGTNGITGWRCFNTGTESTITVPEGMTHMTLAVAGGEGYGGQGPAGGGYSVSVGGTWTVAAGQTVGLTVGQAATDDGPGDGAASGGHAGGSKAGDGGGASAVELDGTVVAVAGGGGGGGAQGILDGTDNGGSGGGGGINNGDGHGGSGPGAGRGHSGGNGPALADGSAGGSGNDGGGAGGGGGGGWGGGSGGGGGGFGGGGGAGGAAGGSYVRPDAQNPSVAVANAGGDGSIVITWN